jgi:quinol monooxygenase YgiN
MAETVSFLVRIRFAPEDRADITECLRQLATESRKEPGCLTYIPHWSEASSDTVLIYEQYRDRAAHETHRASPHFGKYAVGCLYQRMRERAVEDLHVVA